MELCHASQLVRRRSVIIKIMVHVNSEHWYLKSGFICYTLWLTSWPSFHVFLRVNSRILLCTLRRERKKTNGTNNNHHRKKKNLRKTLTSKWFSNEGKAHAGFWQFSTQPSLRTSSWAHDRHRHKVRNVSLNPTHRERATFPARVNDNDATRQEHTTWKREEGKKICGIDQTKDCACCTLRLVGLGCIIASFGGPVIFFTFFFSLSFCPDNLT